MRHPIPITLADGRRLTLLDPTVEDVARLLACAVGEEDAEWEESVLQSIIGDCLRLPAGMAAAELTAADLAAAMTAFWARLTPDQSPRHARAPALDDPEARIENIEQALAVLVLRGCHQPWRWGWQFFNATLTRLVDEHGG